MSDPAPQLHEIRALPDVDAVADEVTRLGECAERLAGAKPEARARILRHLTDLFAEPRQPRAARSRR